MSNSTINFLEKQLEKSLGPGFYKLTGLLKVLGIMSFLLLFGGTSIFTKWNGWESLILTIIVLDIAIWIIWLILRRMPKFKTNKLGILFAIPSYSENEENNLTNEVLTKLYKKLQNNINQRNLTLEFKIKKAISIHCPENAKKGLDLLKKSNATIVISGFSEEGTVHKEKVVAIPTISFIYKDDLKSRESRLSFSQSVIQALSEHKWIVRENETIIDTNYVSQNLGDVSLYIIGSGLYIKACQLEGVDLMNKAIEVLEDLFGRKQGEENKGMWLNTIKHVLYFSYAYKFTFMDFLVKDRNDTAKINEGDRMVGRQKEITKENPGAYIQNAILLFLKGDIPKAKEELGLAEEYSEKKDSAVYYSLAFLEFYENQMKRGLELLQKAISRSRDRLQVFNLNHITEWYHDAIVQDKMFQLNFPLGIIYKKVKGDNNLAKDCLEEFIKWAQKNESWSILDKEREKFIKIAEGNLRDLKIVEV